MIYTDPYACILLLRRKMLSLVKLRLRYIHVIHFIWKNIQSTKSFITCFVILSISKWQHYLLKWDEYIMLPNNVWKLIVLLLLLLLIIIIKGSFPNNVLRHHFFYSFLLLIISLPFKVVLKDGDQMYVDF
jgi:hypothetical protein